MGKKAWAFAALILPLVGCNSSGQLDGKQPPTFIIGELNTTTSIESYGAKITKGKGTIKIREESWHQTPVMVMFEAKKGHANDGKKDNQWLILIENGVGEYGTYDSFSERTEGAAWKEMEINYTDWRIIGWWPLKGAELIAPKKIEKK